MKILKIIVNLLLVLILVTGIGCVAMMVIGIQPYVVVSGSMEPAIPTGSLCFIDKRVDFSQVSSGMVIAFSSTDGTMITHRVVRNTNGGWATKGDANKVEDPGVVTASNYVGRNINHIPKLGFMLESVRDGNGKYVVIIALIVILGLGVLVNSSGQEEKGPKIMKY